MPSTLFRHPDAAAPNIAALGVILAGYPAGIWLLSRSGWALPAIGVLLTMLTLTWSAYFIHEFAHLAIFRSPAANARWGTLMSWINGSCYATFDGMRKKHMRHHVERADVITFDVQAFLRRLPAPLRGLVLALEWAYVPAVELIMHGFVITQPFTQSGRGKSKLRMLAIVAVRAAAFALLAAYSMKAFLLYALSYLLFLTVLRFADCFQHTYDAYPIADDAPIPADKQRDRQYEQFNTYSDIVGLSNPVLNMLWLNFGYHNAHHERPTLPWHRLPAYHRELYNDACAQVITVGELLASFHRHRVRRVLSPDYGVVLPPGAPRRADGFIGAVGVSFLTAV
ncbi:fatty acid desaturase family protein [Noviherbaspirillum pedocola]|uniref:Fatty acid desaturase n=1 Tax=Noviherbaspirillum pedocola TaxID=2801341 RepID=A0A934W850_9BURK|nr:fatty acid desaturase [Noviherbaspirillum pedocola]MBK4737155.1 fatty acid desaturase [Noviherbaspirillum pedocola]